MPSDVRGAFEQFLVGGRAGFDFSGAQVKLLIVGPVQIHSSAARFPAPTGGFQLEHRVARDPPQVAAGCAGDEQIFDHLADGPHPEEFALLCQSAQVSDKGRFALQAIWVVWVADDNYRVSLSHPKLVSQE